MGKFAVGARVERNGGSKLLTNETPEKILYIGDRSEVDLRPAKKLGLRTALVTHAQEQETDFEPDLIFTNPEEVLQFIGAQYLPEK